VFPCSLSPINESLFHLFINKYIKHILKWSSWNAALLASGAKFAEHFGNIFQPLVGEYDLIGKHPNADKTIRHVDKYTACMQELKETLSPELELIETRVIAPAKELQTVMKAIRKNITKRDHKVRV
jgi:amphiphysin